MEASAPGLISHGFESKANCFVSDLRLALHTSRTEAAGRDLNERLTLQGKEATFISHAQLTELVSVNETKRHEKPNSKGVSRAKHQRGCFEAWRNA
jgi:hypothetical protein